MQSATPEPTPTPDSTLDTTPDTTQEPTAPPGRPTHPAAAAIDAAVAHASGLLRVAVESVDVHSLRSVTWADSCLGIPEDGETCADVLTPGYLIELGDGFTYRADEQGRVRRERGRHTTGPVEPEPQVPEPQASDPSGITVPPPGQITLRYVKEGGIGGWRSTFETSSADLSETELAELKELITRSRFYDVDPGPKGSPVHDGVVSRLWIAVDRRAREVVRGDGIEIADEPGFHALIAWVEQRTPPLIPTAEI